MSAGPTPKGELRRTALLDAAERILGSAGGAELTMRAVADAAGVRLGHLQYYFPARSDLVAALLDRILTASLERVAGLTGGQGPAAGPGPAARPGPAAGGLDAALDSVLAEHEDLSLVRLFTEVWAMAAHDPAAAAAVRAFYDRYTDHVAGLILRLRPGLPEAGARSRAEVFVMVMEGAALFRSGIAGTPGPAAEARLRRVLLDLLA
ncbi:TetR family transcriptional regulator [Streptomyces sp. NPDC047976]|uniref:TetR family transcriptional regulator n=1 Tax=Streptomyces sp. NPDC047976 TaxID=3155746 RepID=UPI00343103E2